MFKLNEVILMEGAVKCWSWIRGSVLLLSKMILYIYLRRDFEMGIGFNLMCFWCRVCLFSQICWNMSRFWLCLVWDSFEERFQVFLFCICCCWHFDFIVEVVIMISAVSALAIYFRYIFRIDFEWDWACF